MQLIKRIKKLYKIVLLIVTFAFLEACAFHPIYVPHPPPELIVEIKPVRPYFNAVWITGHWRWSRTKYCYVWTPGCWKKAPAVRIWISGYWQNTPHGWIWIKGYWK